LNTKTSHGLFHLQSNTIPFIDFSILSQQHNHSIFTFIPTTNIYSSPSLSNPYYSSATTVPLPSPNLYLYHSYPTPSNPHIYGYTNTISSPMSPNIEQKYIICFILVQLICQKLTKAQCFKNLGCIKTNINIVSTFNLASRIC
jgi:hypothetical protein